MQAINRPRIKQRNQADGCGLLGPDFGGAWHVRKLHLAQYRLLHGRAHNCELPHGLGHDYRNRPADLCQLG